MSLVFQSVFFLSLTCCERDAINQLLDTVWKIFTTKQEKFNEKLQIQSCVNKGNSDIENTIYFN